MHVDLTQVQPVTNAQGQLMGLVGLDSRGNVYYAEVTASGPGTYKIKWALMAEK